MTNPKILAGAPCGKMPVCNAFPMAFYGLWLPEGSDWKIVEGGNIPKNLNRLVDQALEGNYTHLFIVEDDSTFAPDTVMKLLAHDKPVVTGLCRSRVTPFRPYIYSGITPVGLAYRDLTPEDDGLIKVAATGMGGILINTKVFEKLQRPYFRHAYEGERSWGQDILFGKSLIEAGIDVYCDLDVIIGHVSQSTIGSKKGPNGWNVSVVTSRTYVEFEQPQAEVTHD